ncbi:L-rhamnose mutarotase [soil metagenome]
MTTRHCFLLKVRAERLGDYRAAHASVPRAMLDAIAASGWSNYSIFTDESGLIVGYVEAEDFDGSRALISSSEARAEWDALIGEYFEPLDPARPHEGMRQLPIAFQLEEQLSAR